MSNNVFPFCTNMHNKIINMKILRKYQTDWNHNQHRQTNDDYHHFTLSLLSISHNKTPDSTYKQTLSNTTIVDFKMHIYRCIHALYGTVQQRKAGMCVCFFKWHYTDQQFSDFVLTLHCAAKRCSPYKLLMHL